MSRAFVIDRRDNVATVLQESFIGDVVSVLGESELKTIEAIEDIRPEHKMSLVLISKGDDVVKYGMPIGYAVNDINPGEWVHLHNCASHYDERSNTLDGESGAPTDTEYV